MAGFFENIGEFFTGDKARAAEAEATRVRQLAEAQAAQDRAAAKEVARKAAETQEVAQKDVAQTRADLGGSASEFMQKAQTAAEGQASQAAQAGATYGARNALMAARSAGLNRGQAALRAAYTNQYQQALESGRNQYQNAVQQRQGLGTSQQQMGLQREGTGMQGVSNVYGQSMPMILGQINQQQGWGTRDQAAGAGAIGGALSGISDIVKLVSSDKNAKDNIEKSTSLDDLVKKVKAVDFNYKKESGEDPEKNRVGILAQDLEKTSMKDNVIDTPDGKKIDAGQQTLSNTNLIVQLAEELFALKAELKSLKGGK
jgi:hypothetical protein